MLKMKQLNCSLDDGTCIPQLMKISVTKLTLSHARAFLGNKPKSSSSVTPIPVQLDGFPS